MFACFFGTFVCFFSYLFVDCLGSLGEVGYDPSFEKPFTDPDDDIDNDDEEKKSKSSKKVNSNDNGHNNDSNNQHQQQESNDTDNKSTTSTTTSSSSSEDKSSGLISNPFILSTDWNNAITGLERLILQKNVIHGFDCKDARESIRTFVGYDPNDRSLAEPKAINQRLLPDLYLGWGKAQCSHTKREIVRNRLLCVLLNKLSYNYYKKEQQLEQQQEDDDIDVDEDLFVVRLNPSSKDCIYPQEFIECLIENGHDIEVCPRAQITTFGVGLCVAEGAENDIDGNEGEREWSHIPLACFARSGYESHDARPAHVMFPHGGIDLSIKSGPLVGKNQKCDIQFYMAIEGLCGWHSNHNPEVPWLQNTGSTDIYNKEQTLMVVKLAALLAVTFNAMGTEMNLPFGGYGVLGVCNDTAALLDYAVRGTTSTHPLISTGRYLMHTARRLLRLHNSFEALDGNHKESINGIRRLIAATCNIPSDLHASPSNVIDATNRLLAGQPKDLCFQLEVESKQIMTTLKNKYEQFQHELDNAFVG